MTLNTYELASLNGWDGTNIEMGDNHLLAPQIGAGIKDDATNTFTGMVMGVLTNTSSNEDEKVLTKAEKVDKVGLIGYSNGRQSFFVNAKTGETSLGLPEDDDINISEGRIVLNPGGLSKIGNWKIGSRYLSNIVNGDCERRTDSDVRDPSDLNEKLLIPHDKKGIILSSDRPYIHIKSGKYEEDTVASISYGDEYNSINPGDSLELRLDPNNKSLFSIIQHTQGVADDDSVLFYGFRASAPGDSVKVVSDYVINKANSLEDLENY
jgi:hypothetical protein